MKNIIANKISSFILVSTLLFGSIVFSGCTPEEVDLFTEALVSALASWNAENEQLDEIPQDVDINDNTGSLPASIDLSSKFPPIGNQGEYGTCVAWAVGYNLKTALNGIDKKWNATQLADASNITSPTDLFLSIPSASKGSNCNGTQFETALDQLITRGGASLSVAPYVNLGNCSQAPNSNWSEDASNNKLVNYRKIADKNNAESMKVDNFKAYLAEGRPIVIGARLGDRFMRWNSEAAINSDTYLNPGMQHAYHAMVLAGYDDSRNAFKVINSWGSDWGNNGTIWVDYSFFTQDFCFAGFVAQNKTNISISGNEVGNSNISQGIDLLAWHLVDSDNPEQTEPRCRQITYNVYNSGTEPIMASSDWSILYLYYNAYNANDFGILIHDYYTDDFSTTPGDNATWANGLGLAGSWWNYINVNSSKSVAAELYNDPDADFLFTYTTPESLNGKYYLVLFADGLNKIQEANEDNNLYFFSKENGKPFTFINGVIQDEERPSTKNTNNKKKPTHLFASNECQTVVGPNNVNAYSPKEIKALIEHHYKTGELQKRVTQWYKNKQNTTKKIKSKS